VIFDLIIAQIVIFRTKCFDKFYNVEEIRFFNLQAYNSSVTGSILTADSKPC